MIAMRTLKGPLDVALEATPACVPQARRVVCAIAAQAGACEEDLERVALAVSEAVTNSIVHAYGGSGRGHIQLMAAAVGDELSVLVADDGCGLGSASASPGLGLGMGVIEYSVDSLTITTRATGGTMLEMRFNLRTRESKPARRAAAAPLRGAVAYAA